MENEGRWESIIGPNERKSARIILDGHVGEVMRIEWRDEDGQLSAVYGRLQRVSSHGEGRVVVTIENDVRSSRSSYSFGCYGLGYGGRTVTQFEVGRVHAAWLDTCW